VRAAAPAGKLAQRIGKAVRRAGAASVSRVYADVNESAPRDYWDYEALTVTWGDQDAYEVVKKVGRGKYSEVFEGVKTSSDERCIIKARSWPLQQRPCTRVCALALPRLLTHPARRADSQACEEEEDQARDQDPAGAGRRPQHHHAAGRGSRARQQNAQPGV
jgi:hypothetical protein